MRSESCNSGPRQRCSPSRTGMGFPGSWRKSPGLGPIRIAQLLPVVVTPYRFSSKRAFWSYAGLGIVMRSSSDWIRAQDGHWVRVPVRADTRSEPELQSRAEAGFQRRSDDRDPVGPGRRSSLPTLPAASRWWDEAESGQVDFGTPDRFRCLVDVAIRGGVQPKQVEDSRVAYLGVGRIGCEGIRTCRCSSWRRDGFGGEHP